MENLINKIKNFKRQNAKNQLACFIADYYLNFSDDEKEILNHLGDVLDCGLINGIVSDLIYYVDTIAFYEKYKKDINELLAQNAEYFDTTNICHLVRRYNYDTSDLLALEPQNQNALAWYGFEEMSNNLCAYIFND